MATLNDFQPLAQELIDEAMAYATAHVHNEAEEAKFRKLRSVAQLLVTALNNALNVPRPLVSPLGTYVHDEGVPSEPQVELRATRR